MKYKRTALRFPGSFYTKCGFRERGHVEYKGDPLVYYEFLLA